MPGFIKHLNGYAVSDVLQAFIEGKQGSGRILRDRDGRLTVCFETAAATALAAALAAAVHAIVADGYTLQDLYESDGGDHTVMAFRYGEHGSDLTLSALLYSNQRG